LREEVAGNNALTAKGGQLGIPDWIVHNNPKQASQDRSWIRKMVATAFEALIGAVFEDGGWVAVDLVVKHLGLDQHSLLTGS
jgi:ribonuclease-3